MNLWWTDAYPLHSNGIKELETFMTLHRFSPHIYSPYLHDAKLFQSKMLLKVIYKKTYQYRRGRIYCLSIKLVWLKVSSKHIRLHLIFNMTMLGIHHRLHSLWHWLVERLEVLWSDVVSNHLCDSFQPCFACFFSLFLQVFRLNLWVLNWIEIQVDVG